MLKIVQFCGLYVLCGAGAHLLFSTPYHIPMVWPAAGVFLAALLVIPRANWWALIAALALSEFAIQTQIGALPFSAALILSLLSSGQAIVAALLLQRFRERPLRFERINDVMALLVLGALVPLSLSGIAFSRVANSTFGIPLFDGWIWWLAGNMLQVMAVSPLVLFLFRDGLDRLAQVHRAFWVETIALLAALIAATVFAFTYGFTPGSALPAFSYIPFALLTWIALRLGPRTTALACLMFSFVVLWLDTRSIHAASTDLPSDFLMLGAFLLIAVVTAQSFAAVIAQHRNNSDRLAGNEQKLREVMKLAPIGIYVADKEKYSYTNPAGAKIAGLSDPEEIVGQSVMTYYPPEGKAAAQQRIDSLVDEGSGSRPRVINTIVDAAGNKRIVEAMATAIRWEGTPSFLVMVNDISGRKQAEEAMMRSQKMEAIGQLSGGIAHDFNNILGIIIGNLELAQEMASAEVAERLESALKAVNRGASITHKLLSFSRQNPAAMKLISANAIIENMRELISKSITAAITVELQLSEDLWPINVDAGEFQDALINMALNSRDAMPDGGTLAIATRNKSLDVDYVKLNPLSSEGEFVMISIADTGIGMDRDVKEKIFEPFFSTKVDGKGSGLGLSMVYGFVQRSGGHIQVDTVSGKGTTFRIYLPRAHQATMAVSEKPKTPVSQLRGTETILIVDDEVDFTEIAAHNLGFLGYTVLTASNGSEALDVLNTNPYIDLLFSDVVMPGGQSGYDLAVAAHHADPELKILLTSGFTQRHEEFTNGDDAFISDLGRRLLSKPYNRRELAQAIRGTLDENN